MYSVYRQLFFFSIVLFITNKSKPFWINKTLDSSLPVTWASVPTPHPPNHWLFSHAWPAADSCHSYPWRPPQTPVVVGEGWVPNQSTAAHPDPQPLQSSLHQGARPVQKGAWGSWHKSVRQFRCGAAPQRSPEGPAEASAHLGHGTKTQEQKIEVKM